MHSGNFLRFWLWEFYSWYSQQCCLRCFESLLSYWKGKKLWRKHRKLWVPKGAGPSQLWDHHPQTEALQVSSTSYNLPAFPLSQPDLSHQPLSLSIGVWHFRREETDTDSQSLIGGSPYASFLMLLGITPDPPSGKATQDESQDLPSARSPGNLPSFICL